MIKVLFVCHGNICRSPIAEFTLKHLVATRGLSDRFHIASAATSNEEIGNAAFTVINKLIKDIDLPNLRSFGLTKEEILAVVPDGVMAMVQGMIKLFGSGTAPVTVTPELLADIVSRAYDEN